VVTLRETITVNRPIDQAFAYTAAWENTERWDPGVARSTAKQAGEPKVGSAYDLVLQFGSRQTPMEYVITELSAPNRIVLEGTGNMVTAVDTIEFETTGDATRIHYTAELTFSGIMSIVTKFMGGRLDNIGKDGVAGLKRELDSGAS
jgi:carbon monoxide dehydrogenase subunit G